MIGAQIQYYSLYIAKIISGVKVPTNHIKSNEIVLNLSLES